MRRAQDVKQLYNAFPAIQEKFRCVGHVPDAELPHFYRGAELFLFPSFYEGFGLPPLEAMSCGCPTIVSNAGALPEVCKEAALYINPRDPAAIARRCAELLRDSALREELARRGQAHSRLFCWKQCAEAHYTMMDETISSRL
jgi:glycosyltransferase involved in cell wall biosynthesis